MKKKLTHEVHTVYLCFLTRLIVAAVWLIVQLLGNNTEKLRLVLITVIVGGADINQLHTQRDKSRETFIKHYWR